MTTEPQRTKEQIVGMLRTFAAQRPGLEYGNYGDPTSYRAEVRQITQDLHDARELIRAVELSGMTAAELTEGFRAYSGRLTLTETGLDYCTGQYWPTEYRKAVCAVCAAALWEYMREDYANDAKPGESPGDAIRRNFKRRYGARLARRWFD